MNMCSNPPHNKNADVVWGNLTKKVKAKMKTGLLAKKKVLMQHSLDLQIADFQEAFACRQFSLSTWASDRARSWWDVLPVVPKCGKMCFMCGTPCNRALGRHFIRLADGNPAHLCFHCDLHELYGEQTVRPGVTPFCSIAAGSNGDSRLLLRLEVFPLLFQFSHFGTSFLFRAL